MGETIKNADPLFRDADLGYFDDDHDGRLSRREFVDKPSPFFLRYDKNSDCRVTPDELKGASTEGEKTGTSPHGRGRGGGLRWKRGALDGLHIQSANVWERSRNALDRV